MSDANPPFMVMVTFTRPGFAARQQLFDRIPVVGDRIVVLGEAKADGAMHMRVADVLLLPSSNQASFPSAEVRVVGPPALDEDLLKRKRKRRDE